MYAYPPYSMHTGFCFFFHPKSNVESVFFFSYFIVFNFTAW